MTMQTNEKTALDRNQDRHVEQPNLDRRYGQIGIAAVVAALEYWTSAKKPARSPGIDERFIELAA
jgi:hypothetical protein